MRRVSISGLPYHLGISSLDQIASREDRIVVLNAMGGESRLVTPISHAFSGGNVVFGVSPGRRGQVLATAAGDIPIYNTVREGMKDGHSFNTGVAYLPPSGVRDGVAELIRVNKSLQKIIIVTEKIAVHDAREIRAIAQANHVDVIGGNCLGVADSWNQVRIGGALGGDNPAEVLRRGSVALFSNSGGFTTTIAQYLGTAGWGTTTLISSGKDVYIHYSVRDFAHAFGADARSKAAVLYVEPGGYYEHNLAFDKPVVACVVGRWKSRLTRAVGHAGAMSGSGDAAEDKERWFMEMFGTKGIYTPETPHASAKGALVTSIAHIPEALSTVMAMNGEQPDFDATGTLALKPWMANDLDLPLPTVLSLPVDTAPAPYCGQIRAQASQLGAMISRQTMKDRSGATVMDARTQITSLHGKSVFELAGAQAEAIYALPFLRDLVDAPMQSLFAAAILSEVEEQPMETHAAVSAARSAGNAPNLVMSMAAALVGPAEVEPALVASRALIQAFAESGLNDPLDPAFDISSVPVHDTALFRDVPGPEEGQAANRLLARIRSLNVDTAFLKYLERLDIPLSRNAVLAAISLSAAWQPLMRKRISRLTAETAVWYLRLYGAMIGATASDLSSLSYGGQPQPTDAAELCFYALTGRLPDASETEGLTTLLGLLVSNGPGAISAQGAKGAVAADGPQTPERVQINKAMIGFLTHTGFSHGGNGFEGIALLLDAFQSSGLQDPSDPNHGLDLDEMATSFAIRFKRTKTSAKELGEDVPAIPGVHHPVFKGKAINHDPRERFLAAHQEKNGQYNIFHDYYLKVVQALHREGASPYVFCVNIDAVIAAVLLKTLWSDFQSKRLSSRDMEEAAFKLFLYSRMIGAAAEIDDHLNRGRNMDTRTKASVCEYVV